MTQKHTATKQYSIRGKYSIEGFRLTKVSHQILTPVKNTPSHKMVPEEPCPLLYHLYMGEMTMKAHVTKLNFTTKQTTPEKSCITRLKNHYKR